VQQENSEKNSAFIGNKTSLKPIECLVSTTELLHSKKRTKFEDVSNITLGYIKNKHPDRLVQRQQVLVDTCEWSNLEQPKICKELEGNTA
jgi:hypothetical protein